MPLIERSWGDVRARFPDVDEARLVPELVRDQIGLMVGDVLEETGRRLADAAVETVEDVRRAGRPLAGFSSAMAAEEAVLKRFLHARMYNAPPVMDVRDQAQAVVARLSPPIARIRGGFRRNGSRPRPTRSGRSAPSATSSPE